MKLLSAKDAFWYAVGRFDEPEGMRWPLWDADCRRCHARFAERSTAGSAGNPLFHELAVHNAELPVRCVECHAAHERGVVHRLFTPIADWQQKARGPVTGRPTPSGHYIPEEVPDLLVEEMFAFFPDR